MKRSGNAPGRSGREDRCMNITIVGAGNIGTQFAVHCAEKGHNVTIYGSKPEKIGRNLSIVNENAQVIHQGAIKAAVSDAQEAFADAELVFVTMPAMLMRQNAKKIEPFAKPGMKICLVPGTGGGECAFKTCLEKGAAIFGLQRVPSVARLVEYGKTVRAVGYRDELFVSALPNGDTDICRRIIETIFDMKTTALPNYLNITLTPSNPILHTARLRNIFGDYHKGMVYESVPLFYEDWTNASSELLLECDAEVQNICRALHAFDLSYVKSLKEHYESPNAEALTRKITSITGFKGLASPAVKTEKGYIPDFSSRYFTADFSYGLAILVQIAAFAGVEVPHMSETLNWYYDLTGRRDEYRYSDYGIGNAGDFTDFYSK